MVFSSLLKVSLLSLALTGVNAVTQFSIAPDGISCSGQFQVTSLEVFCDGEDGLCTFGSEVRAQGTVTITDEMSSNAQTTVKAMNMVTLYNGNTNFCGCLESSDGSSECPSPGDYTLLEFGGIDIPGSSDSFYAGSGYFGTSISISATFDFENGATTTCTTSVVLSNNSSTVAVSVVVLVGLAATAFGIRKRRVATIQLEEEEGTKTHFEMMPNGESVHV